MCRWADGRGGSGTLPSVHLPVIHHVTVLELRRHTAPPRPEARGTPLPAPPDTAKEQPQLPRLLPSRSRPLTRLAAPQHPAPILAREGAAVMALPALMRACAGRGTTTTRRSPSS